MGVLLLSFVCSMAAMEKLHNGEEAAKLRGRECNRIMRMFLNRDVVWSSESLGSNGLSIAV